MTPEIYRHLKEGRRGEIFKNKLLDLKKYLNKFNMAEVDEKTLLGDVKSGF